MLKYGIPEQKYGEYGAHYNNSKYGKKSNRARLYIKSAFVFMLTASIIIWMNSIPIGAFDGADSFSDIASEQEWEMLKEVNAGRIKADLSPLTITKEMQNAAGKRVIELSSSFSHERPGGSVGYTAIKREGVSYDAAAENIAAGKDDASVIFSGLMKSEENKKNILLPYSSHIGIGYEEAKGSEYGHYWVQLFIKSGKCIFTDIKIISDDEIHIPYGGKLQDQDICVELTCKNCGKSYMPLLDEMCAGFDALMATSQDVTLNYKNLSADIKVVVEGDQRKSVNIDNEKVQENQALSRESFNIEVSQGGRVELASDVNMQFYSQLIAIPDDGYTFGGWYIDGRQVSNNEIYLYDVKEKEEINAVFLKESEKDTMSLSDVSAQDWYYDAIEFVIDRSLMAGISDDRFAPNEQISRATVATVLYRVEGMPDVEYAPIFEDVPEGKWYSDAVIWAYRESIANGYTLENFGTEQSVTREEFITMLYRYKISVGYETSDAADLSGFADSDEINDFAVEAFNWAVDTGLVGGDLSHRLDPQGYATRAQFATIIKRLLQLRG